MPDLLDVRGETVEFAIDRCNQSTNNSIILAGVDRRYLGSSLRIKSKAIHSIRALFESRARNLYAYLAASSLCGLNFNGSSFDLLEVLDKELVNALPHTPLYIPPIFPHNPSALPTQLCIDLS